MPQAVRATLAVAACAPLIWLYVKNLEANARYSDGYADRVSRNRLAMVESGVAQEADGELYPGQVVALGTVTPETE
jgi:hypothetical protein